MTDRQGFVRVADAGLPSYEWEPSSITLSMVHEMVAEPTIESSKRSVMRTFLLGTPTQSLRSTVASPRTAYSAFSFCTSSIWKVVMVESNMFRFSSRYIVLRILSFSSKEQPFGCIAASRETTCALEQIFLPPLDHCSLYLPPANPNICSKHTSNCHCSRKILPFSSLEIHQQLSSPPLFDAINFSSNTHTHKSMQGNCKLQQQYVCYACTNHKRPSLLQENAYDPVQPPTPVIPHPDQINKPQATLSLPGRILTTVKSNFPHLKPIPPFPYNPTIRRHLIRDFIHDA